MDPLVAAVVTILGKYAIDTGVTLLKEAGPAAVEVAGRLFRKVMERLKADPAEAKNAERFEKNPEGYAQSMLDAVAELIKADPVFTAQVKALLEEFQATERAAGVAITTSQGTATASSGSLAVGSISIGGSVGGSIDIQGSNPPPAEG
jgi:hypothetical protein